MKYIRFWTFLALALMISAQAAAEDTNDMMGGCDPVIEPQKESDPERVDNKIGDTINQGLNNAKDGINKAGNAVAETIDKSFDKINNVTKD